MVQQQISHRETFLENFAGELNVTKIKQFKINLFFNTSFFCAVSEFSYSLVRSFGFFYEWIEDGT